MRLASGSMMSSSRKVSHVVCVIYVLLAFYCCLLLFTSPHVFACSGHRELCYVLLPFVVVCCCSNVCCCLLLHMCVHAVATESFLQDWNIALIVIGVVAFAVGDGIAGGLGTMLAMRSVQLNGERYYMTCE